MTNTPPARVRLADLFDAETRRHDEHFYAAVTIERDHDILDIGCGTGQSTRAAARATDGRVLGVDVSAPLIEHARTLTEREGLDNVAYVEADAQTYPFTDASFDLCISHFGTMFFSDPAAAFANIARALRPGGQLVMLVWQTRERNESATLEREALLPGSPPPSPGPGMDAFSLGDVEIVERILGDAGFSAIRFTDVREPVYYGPDVATAYDFVMSLHEPQEMLAALDPAERKPAIARLQAALASHLTDEGVLLGSQAWVISAVVAATGRG